MSRNIRSLTLFAFSILAMAGCHRDRLDPSSLTLPVTPLFTDDREWGVVMEPYVRAGREPAEEKDITITLRKGEIVELLEIKQVNGDYWSLITLNGREGWILRSQVSIYATQQQAETAVVDQGIGMK